MIDNEDLVDGRWWVGNIATVTALLTKLDDDRWFLWHCPYGPNELVESEFPWQDVREMLHFFSLSSAAFDFEYEQYERHVSEALRRGIGRFKVPDTLIYERSRAIAKITRSLILSLSPKIYLTHRELRKGWDGYDADPPNTWAIETAEDFASRLGRLKPRVRPSAIGGVGVTVWQVVEGQPGDRKCYAEFSNRGTGVLLYSDDKTEFMETELLPTEFGYDFPYEHKIMRFLYQEAFSVESTDL